MKTDRLTLLISPVDKAAINARAEALGISVSELIRRAALDYDPEEDAIKAQIEALLPEVGAAIGRMHDTFNRIEANSACHREEMQRLRSPEYREQTRRELWADPAIDWERIRALREGALFKAGESARTA